MIRGEVKEHAPKQDVLVGKQNELVFFLPTYPVLKVLSQFPPKSAT